MENTYYLKQTTAGGADTAATTKHPKVPTAKEWHRQHFSQTRKQYFHTTTDIQQPVARLEWLARLNSLKFVVTNMVQKERNIFQVLRSEDPYTHCWGQCPPLVVIGFVESWHLCAVGEQPTASPPKWARVYCGFRPGPTRVMTHPGRMVSHLIISGTSWESNVCTAISGTIGYSRCCTDWASWSLASEGTDIEVWSCIESCCVCRVPRHSAHSRLAAVLVLRMIGWCCLSGRDVVGGLIAFSAQ